MPSVVNDLERVATLLMMMMEDCGLPIDSKSRMRTYIYHAFNDDRIKFLDRDGQQAGFVIWEIYKKENILDIYISHLVIIDRFRGFNLKTIITFLKNKYPDVDKIHWDNNKKNKRIDRRASVTSTI